MKNAVIWIAALIILQAQLSAHAAMKTKVDHVAAGQKVYERHCVACHGPGHGMPPYGELPGTEALRYKYNGKLPAVLTDRTDLTPELITYFVRNGVSVMPFFRKTEISDADLAYLGTYLSRNNRATSSRRK